MGYTCEWGTMFNGVRMPLLEVCLYGESTYRGNTPERRSVLICSELLITLVDAYKVEVLVWRRCLFSEVARVRIFRLYFKVGMRVVIYRNIRSDTCPLDGFVISDVKGI